MVTSGSATDNRTYIIIKGFTFKTRKKHIDLLIM